MVRVPLLEIVFAPALISAVKAQPSSVVRVIAPAFVKLAATTALALVEQLPAMVRS